MKGHGVDGEIASCQVFFDGVHEQNAVGMAMVGVRSLGAEGGYLYGLALAYHGYRSMLRPRFVDRHAAGQTRLSRLLPSGVGGYVGIVGRNAAKGVAHKAANQPCFEPLCLKRIDNGAHRSGKLGEHSVGFDMWRIF